MDRNRLIGAGNRLPWRLPDDMARFKAITMGKPVIMGRKTYESIPEKYRPLSGRHNIIVTRNQDYQAEGCTVVHSPAEALAAAGDAEEIIIAGGAQLYETLLPVADRIYLTLIDGTFEGDTYFPELDMNLWQQVKREEHPADERHRYHFSWILLKSTLSNQD